MKCRVQGQSQERVVVLTNLYDSGRSYGYDDCVNKGKS